MSSIEHSSELVVQYQSPFYSSRFVQQARPLKTPPIMQPTLYPYKSTASRPRPLPSTIASYAATLAALFLSFLTCPRSLRHPDGVIYSSRRAQKISNKIPKNVTTTILDCGTKQGKSSMAHPLDPSRLPYGLGPSSV